MPSRGRWNVPPAGGPLPDYSFDSRAGRLLRFRCAGAAPRLVVVLQEVRNESFQKTFPVLALRHRDQGGGTRGIRRCPGFDVTLHTGEATAGEIQHQVSPDRGSGALAQGVDVIPTVRVERVDEEGSPQDEAHLALLHPDLQPVNHLLVDDVALLDIDAVQARQVGHLASATRAEHGDQYESGGPCGGRGRPRAGIFVTFHRASLSRGRWSSA